MLPAIPLVALGVAFITLPLLFVKKETTVAATSQENSPQKHEAVKKNVAAKKEEREAKADENIDQNFTGADDESITEN